MLCLLFVALPLLLVLVGLVCGVLRGWWGWRWLLVWWSRSRNLRWRGESAAGGFALPGGGGVVDVRTGKVGVKVPVASVPGRGEGSGASLGIEFSQDFAGVDRFGLGRGWSWGLGFVDVTAGKVATSAGVYSIAAGYPSGLKDYPLEDVVFKKTSGITPASSAYPQGRAYGYVMSMADGSRDFYDAQGNLITRVDRHGSAVEFVFEGSGASHRLSRMVGALGQEVSVSYVSGEVRVDHAVRGQDGKRPRTVVQTAGGRLVKVTDPEGRATSYNYTTLGTPAVEVLSEVTSPLGAVTKVELGTIAGGIIAARSWQVTDRNGQLSPKTTLNFDPSGNGQRNHTGYPKPVAGPITDRAYSYQVEVNDGLTRARYTYNNLHLLKGAEQFAVKTGAKVLSEKLAYHGETPDGKSPDPAKLPANYQRPTETATTWFDPKNPSRARTETQRQEFNALGLPVKQTGQDGTVTETEYGPHTIPVKQTVTGSDGLVTETVNELSDDKKDVAKSVTRANTAEDKGSLETTGSTELKHDEYGRVTEQVQVSADGKERAVSKTEILEDPAKRTVTVKSTDPEGVTGVQVVDTANEKVLTETDGAGNTTKHAYDLVGQQTETIHADGQKTTVEHQVAGPTGTGTNATVTTAPGGYATRTVTDALGREIRAEDNYNAETRAADRELAQARGDRLRPRRPHRQGRRRRRPGDQIGVRRVRTRRQGDRAERRRNDHRT